MFKQAVFFVVAVLAILAFTFRPARAQGERLTWWNFQSVDVMKYSRDIAREKLKNASFDATIDEQVKNIAATGATHVAIATPYDEEFVPFLRRWVQAARKYQLKVWFRGNWSGWEGWFGYPSISRDEHITKTREFILNHRDLFVDGDVFTGCPECENGGPGDPRRTGDVAGHRGFLAREYQVSRAAFDQIGKQVAANYFSMNGDVARLVMDKKTTADLGGIVTIDHYVATPERLVKDVKDLAYRSGGKIILGELGVPIPDIHGRMTEQQQARWLHDALAGLRAVPEVVGANYWVATGGSTQLWDERGKARAAAGVLKSYFAPAILTLSVTNEVGWPVPTAQVEYQSRWFAADSRGEVRLPFVPEQTLLRLVATGYQDQGVAAASDSIRLDATLLKDRPSVWFKAWKLLYRLWRSIIP